MEIFCSECMTALTMADEDTAVCPACGSRYAVMFSRDSAEIAAADAQPAPVPITAQGRTDASEGAEKVLVQCPKCGRKFRLARESIGKQGRCSCGEVFEILACDVVVEKADAPEMALMCAQHPDVPADYTCLRCGEQICRTCAFTMSDGTVLCSACAASPAMVVSGVPSVRPLLAPLPAAALTALTGRMCRWHGDVQAVGFCVNCKAPICATCDFAFPGGIHLCPTCATTPQKKLSSKRKRLVGWAMGLAIWSTLGLILIFSGALAGAVSSGGDLAALNLVIGILFIGPLIAGAALGFACMDHRLGNPPIVWVVAIWNGLLLAVLILLNIIRAFMT